MSIKLNFEMLRSKLSEKNIEQLQETRLRHYERLITENDEGERKAILDLIKVIDEEVGTLNESFLWPTKDHFRVELREKVKELILDAKNSIWVCVFNITDTEIIDLLIRKEEEGVEVRIITDEDNVFQDNTDLIKNIKFSRIIHSQIKTKTALPNPNIHMHHKFMIVDNKKLLTGSYNWTKNAYDRNWENILITNSKRIISNYSKSFQLIWFDYLGEKL